MNRLVFAVDDLATELGKLGIPPRPPGEPIARLHLDDELFDAAKREIENRNGRKWPEGIELRLSNVVLCRK